MAKKKSHVEKIFMFPFTYLFKREIKIQKTSKNVTDSIRDSLIQRELDIITIENNIIEGKKSLFTIDFSHRSPLVISPNKEEFKYFEDEKILRYTVKIFHSTLLYLIYSLFIFFVFDLFIKHFIIKLICSITFFVIINFIIYVQYQTVIDNISRKLNEN